MHELCFEVVFPSQGRGQNYRPGSRLTAEIKVNGRDRIVNLNH